MKPTAVYALLFLVQCYGAVGFQASIDPMSGNLTFSFQGVRSGGRAQAYDATFDGPTGMSYQYFHDVNVSWTNTSNTLTLQYHWATINWTWDLDRTESDVNRLLPNLFSSLAHTVDAGSFAVNISVTNHWNSTLRRVDLWLSDPHDPTIGKWMFPQPPRDDLNFVRGCSFKAGWRCVANTSVHPAGMVADWGDGACGAMLSSDGDYLPEGMTVGWEQTYGYHLTAGVGPVPVGKTVKARLQLAFAPGSQGSNFSEAANSVLGLIAPAIDAFREAYPMKLHWPDRRPMATMFLAQNGASTSCKSLSPTDCPNPRGYTFARGLNLTTPGGVAAFQTQFLDLVNASIQRINSFPDAARPQAMLFWDLEGEEWTWITYVGSPDMLSDLAPEMDRAADAAFKLVLDAGYKLGMTLRPQKITKDAGWNPSIPPRQKPQEWIQKEQLLPGTNTTDADAVVKLLSGKATYANNRWGATIFYVDTDAGIDGVYPAEVWQQLQAKHPTFLFLPELADEQTQLFAWAGSLTNNEGRVTKTNYLVNATWPAAVSLNNMQSGSVPPLTHDGVLPYAEAVARGDMLNCFGWWDDPRNAVVVAAYEMVANGTVPMVEFGRPERV